MLPPSGFRAPSGVGDDVGAGEGKLVLGKAVGCDAGEFVGFNVGKCVGLAVCGRGGAWDGNNEPSHVAANSTSYTLSYVFSIAVAYPEPNVFTNDTTDQPSNSFAYAVTIKSSNTTAVTVPDDVTSCTNIKTCPQVRVLADGIRRSSIAPLHNVFVCLLKLVTESFWHLLRTQSVENFSVSCDLPGDKKEDHRTTFQYVPQP
jgi:hypothetical protein